MAAADGGDGSCCPAGSLPQLILDEALDAAGTVEKVEGTHTQRGAGCHSLRAPLPPPPPCLGRRPQPWELTVRAGLLRHGRVLLPATGIHPPAAACTAAQSDQNCTVCQLDAQAAAPSPPLSRQAASTMGVLVVYDIFGFGGGRNKGCACCQSGSRVAGKSIRCPARGAAGDGGGGGELYWYRRPSNAPPPHPAA